MKKQQQEQGWVRGTGSALSFIPGDKGISGKYLWIQYPLGYPDIIKEISFIPIGLGYPISLDPCGKDVDPKGARSRPQVRNPVIPMGRLMAHSRNLPWPKKMNWETL